MIIPADLQEEPYEAPQHAFKHVPSSPPSWPSTALTADRPTVPDVYCDPNIPPIPPPATVEQIKSVTEAMLRGDPDAWDMLTKGLRTKLTELFR